MEQKLTLTVSRMEGTSNAKCRLWRLRLFCGGKPAKSKRFHGTYSQAKAAGEDFKAEYAAQLALTGYDPDMTFERYAQRWLQRRRDSGSFQNQTLKKDEWNVSCLCRIIGGEKVSELTRPKVVECLGALKNGAVSGKKIANSTLTNYHKTLKCILSEAVYDELIPKSPMRDVKPPKPDTEPKEAVPFDDYMRAVEALCESPADPRAVGIALIALNGFRRSEVVALDWSDDLGDGLRVDESVEYATGLKKKPKSSAGERTVPMSARTRKLLDEWRAEQGRQLNALGMGQGAGTPILTDGDGKRVSGDSLYRWWRLRGPRDYGVSCTVHELRHTFLTYLAKNGDTFALKRIAGWSKIAMADVYVHADEQADRDAMAQLEKRAERYKSGTKKTQRKPTQGNAKQHGGSA